MKRRTILTALALAVGGSQLTHKSEGKNAAPPSAAAISQDVAAVEREFRVSTEKRLDLDLETGGGIDIVGTDEDVVSVKLYPGGRDWQDCKFEAEETASGVRVSARYVGTQKQYSTSLRFELRIPRRFNVEIASNGGGIRIDGVEGVINGKTMGGGLTLSGLKGNVYLATMGGDVTLSDSQVDGRVETNSGTVLIRDTTGDIKGTSGSGNVVYRNVTDRSGRLLTR